MNPSQKNISLFIPCLVDQVYPEIGIAMLKLLHHFNFQVHYNREQTCCGQPGFNAGYREEATQVARHCVHVFQEDEMIVSPSGSCTGMMRNYYPKLFEKNPLYDEACAVGGRVWELSEFLFRENLVESINGQFSGKVGFHNSCHSYRELGIPLDKPLEILTRISGIEICQPAGEPVCCGFGGLFSFKFDQISETMAQSLLEQFLQAGATTIVTNDPGCLMHMRQEALDRHLPIEILHLVEFLVRAMELA